jgi:hypothetical protein
MVKGEQILKDKLLERINDKFTYFTVHSSSSCVLSESGLISIHTN